MMSKVIHKQLTKAEYERRRKMEERIEFARLQMLVPALEIGDSRIKTLRSTVKYIEDLQYHLTEIDKRLQRLYQQSHVEEETVKMDGEEILGI
jgi:hypothetical protein